MDRRSDCEPLSPLDYLGTFVEEDYSVLRKNAQAEAVVIACQPTQEPAWMKHDAALPPKPARFEKLQRWGKRADQIRDVARWAIFLASAATVAPAFMHLVH